jgi:hypothetical protein
VPTWTNRHFQLPTLSLYLGGTGISVGEALLSMLDALPKADRPVVEPFFIDAQVPKISNHQRSRHYGYRDLGEFDLPIYAEFSAQRFPENRGRSPVQDSREGCGVTRIFGAASLVAKRDDFFDLLTQGVRRLKAQRDQSSQPIQVFLTASSCGGTGAGMLLDAAAMVRQYFRENDDENPRIYLFLIGPGALAKDPQTNASESQIRRMKASTYALLKELHHFASGHSFRSAYRLRDRPIDLSNRGEGDRLFDWVYYLDGCPEGEAARSLDELVWATAEVQLHLGMTEVGRKVAESMPNQREERERGFADEYVHPEYREEMQEQQKVSLRRSSRRSFLATFSVRNLRFPAYETKEWFRWRWVAATLGRILERHRGDESEAEIDRSDRLLGLGRNGISEVGLLADLGLSREGLQSWIESRADLQSPLAGLGFAKTDDPARPISGVGEMIEQGRSLVSDLKSLSNLSGATGGRTSRAQEKLRSALESWKATWTGGFADGGAVVRRLWEFAWDPAAGGGLIKLDALLVRAAEALMELAARERPRGDEAALEQKILDLETSHRGLEKKCEKESRGLRFKLRSWIPSGEESQRGARRLPFEPATARRIDQRLRDARRIQDELEEIWRQAVVDAIEAHVWVEAATALRRFRESHVTPALNVVENALSKTENRRDLAQNALASGRSDGPTTRCLADPDLLGKLEARLADRIWVEESTVTLLFGPGITKGRQRLTYESLQHFGFERVVEMLYEHVESETRGVLSALDSAWQIPSVADHLRQQGAAILDRGAEPLASFSQASLGVRTKGYLISPESLLLGDPFGRGINSFTRLAGDDPFQIGVVTFTFGIPPNALIGIEDLFTCYCLHLGDRDRHVDADRFPLHVFRDAPESFDEPHSPLDLDFEEELSGLKAWLESKLERPIVLDIRDRGDLGDDLGTSMSSSS